MITEQRGIALGVAVFAMALIGMLVAAAFFAGTLEQRAGENGRRLQQAFSLAEAGIGSQLDGWDPGALNSLPIYPAETAPVAERAFASGTSEGRVLRLNETLYLIDVTGRDSLRGSGSAGARQRIGLVTQVMPLQIVTRAPLTAGSSAHLRGNVHLDGADHAPPGWADCGQPDSAKAGILAGGPVTIVGDATVAGNPPVAHDTAITAAPRYDELAALATITHAGGAFASRPTLRGDVCDRSDPLNWGDGRAPTGPCGGHAPIIHIRGDATLTAGHGQGILLVDGDLSIAGRYEFFGLIVVRGRLMVAPEGVDAAVWGSVFAQRVELEMGGRLGRFQVKHSKCAGSKALRMTARPARLGSRGWSQLF